MKGRALRDIIDRTIDRWNMACKDHKSGYEFLLDVKCRRKKYFINRIDFYEKPIAEMSLFAKGDGSSKNPDILLWRREQVMPGKVKGVRQGEVDDVFINDLYEIFVYELLGNFCVTTRSLILSKDYAEYDIENDRVKPDVSGDGAIVETLVGGDFYEAKNEFDVFMITDDYYHVYTAHAIGKLNNGVARIPVKDAMIKKLAKVKIITLN